MKVKHKHAVIWSQSNTINIIAEIPAVESQRNSLSYSTLNILFASVINYD